MLKIIQIKYNIKSNRLAKIKFKNNIIHLNLITFKKLLKIFIFVILISYNFK